MAHDREPDGEDEPREQQVVRQVAQVVRVEIDVHEPEHDQQRTEPPVADDQQRDPEDTEGDEDRVGGRNEVLHDLRHRRPGGLDAVEREEVHVAAELGAADQVEEAVPRREPAVDLVRSDLGTQRDVEVRQEPDGERAGRLHEDPRVLADLAARVDEHEHDDDRHDRDRQPVVRDAQAAQQSPEEQVPVAPLVAPDERTVEEGRDEQEVEPVHLGERGLLPERARERETQRGGGRDHRADVEADHDQDRDADRGGRGNRREHVGSPRHAPDRDRRERLHQERVERVAGRVHDPETGGDHLGLGPVTDAHAGQHSPDVDDGGDDGRDDGGHGGRHRWLSDPVQHRDGWYRHLAP